MNSVVELLTALITIAIGVWILCEITDYFDPYADVKKDMKKRDWEYRKYRDLQRKNESKK